MNLIICVAFFSFTALDVVHQREIQKKSKKLIK